MSKNLRGLSARRGLAPSLYADTLKAAAAADQAEWQRLAAASLVSEASLLGAAASYDFPTQEAAGQRLFLCDGTACLVSGRQGPLRDALAPHFNPGEIGHATCLGHCHRNDACLIDQATRILADYPRQGEPGRGAPNSREGAPRPATEPPLAPPPPVPVASLGEPLLLAPIPDLEAYYAPLFAAARAPAQAIEEIARSGLRGRGGAGYPFHLKLRAAREAQGTPKSVVCNADEGDPGAFSDKWLLEERPQAVLAGMLAAGLMIGAKTGVLYIRREYPEARLAIEAAIGALAGLGLTGNDIRSSGQDFRFEIVVGAGAYVCGEETALLNSIEGLRPEVRTRPPYPTHYGLFGQPTLLSNVETLANLPFILARGGNAYAALGLPACTGTKLISLDGGFNRPGLYEVPMGTPLRQVRDDLGGGTRYPVKAYQVGGPLGGLVPAGKVADLTLDFESFARQGFVLGHAGIIAIPTHFPLVDLLTHLFAFAARESCGKCFPCRIGTRRGQELLEGARQQGRPIDPALFADLLDTLEDGSLCALGGGLPLPVRNALTYFGEELAPWFEPGSVNSG